METETPKSDTTVGREAGVGCAPCGGSESATWTPPPIRVAFSSPTLKADFMLPPAAAMRLGRVVLDTMLEHLPNGEVSDARIRSADLLALRPTENLPKINEEISCNTQHDGYTATKMQRASNPTLGENKMNSQDLNKQLVQKVVIRDCGALGEDAPLSKLSAESVSDLQYVAKDEGVDYAKAYAECETIAELCATIYPHGW